MHNPEETILFTVKAVPGASKTEIAGLYGGKLRIRVAAAPEGGKANKELLAFLAKTLDCPKKDLAITGGAKSPQKTISLKREHGEKLRLLLLRYPLL